MAAPAIIGYEVDSYHINCGIGDCSIHLLVVLYANNKTALGRAVLMDGGTKQQHNALVNFDSTIKDIEEDPRYGLGGRPLRFHTVVITHWDEDHYGGISLMLKREADGNRLVNNQFARFFYGDSGPETTVYAPNDLHEGKGGIVLDPANGGTMCFKPEEPDKKKKPQKPDDLNTSNQPIKDLYPNLTKAYWGEEIVGHEFFFATPSSTPRGRIQHLKDLARGAIPGMYCVASNKNIIGAGEVQGGWPYDMKKRPDQSMHVEPSTPTNQESICAIIAWKNGDDDFRVSHYLGGDIHARSECWLAVWLSKSGVKRITCVKSSHHGARTSNPPLFLTTFEPKYIIISARDRHGHPSWQFLVMILAYVSRQRAKDPNFPAPGLFTIFPYWLTAVHGDEGFDEKAHNTDAMNPNFSVTRVRRRHANHFVHAMKETFAEFWKKSSIGELYEELSEQRNLSPEYVFEKIALTIFLEEHKLWQNLWKDIDVQDLGAERNPLRSVMVRLTSKPATDGEAWVGFRNGKAVKVQRDDNTMKSETNSVIDLGNLETKPSDIPMNVETVPLSDAADFPGIEPDEEPPSDTDEEPTSNTDEEPTSNTNEAPTSVDTQGDIDMRSNIDPNDVGGVLELSKKIGKNRDRVPPKTHYTRSRTKKNKEGDVKDESADDKSKRPSRREKITFQSTAMLEMETHEVQFSTLEASPDMSSPPSDGPFAILSADLRLKGDTFPSLGSHHRILQEPDDAALNTFTSSLLTMSLHLVTAPAPEGTSLNPQDVLSLWLDLALKAKLSVHGTASTVSELRIEAGKMVFSTNAAAAMVGRKDAGVTPIGLSPVTNNETMVFGLMKSPQTTPVEQSFGTGDIIGLLAAEGANADSLSSSLLAEAASGLLEGVRWKMSHSEGSRNGIWVTPGARCLTVARLEYALAENSGQALNAFLAGLLDSPDALVISGVSLIFKKTCKMDHRPSGRMGLHTTRSAVLVANVSIKSVDLKVSVELLSRTGLTLKVWTINRSADFGSLVRGLVKTKIPGADTSFGVLSSDAGITKDDTHFWFRRLELRFDTNAHFSSATLSIEANAQLGRVEDADKEVPGQNVALLLEGGYNAEGSSKWSLSGGLWFKQDYDAIPCPLWSEWEAIHVFEPVTEDAARVLLLNNLLPGHDIDIPAGIPNAITKADFFVTGQEFSFGGTISNCRHEGEEGSDVPTLRLDEVTVDAVFGWSPKYLSLALQFRFALSLPAGEEEDQDDHAHDSEIRGAWSFDSRAGWSLAGGVKGLNLGQLYGFFQDDVKDLLYDLLKGIEVKNLTFAYVKENGGTAFLSQCQMMLGEHESITFHYTYRKGGKWQFYAELDSDRHVEKPFTLGSILGSLSDPGSSLVSDLPPFLTDLTILSPDSKPLKFEIRIDKAPTEGVTLLASIEIAGFQAKFVQLTVPSEKEGERSTTYRLFKAVLKEIEMPKDVPLLSTIEKPFDELGFAWLNRDMTAHELAALDGEMVVAKDGSKEGDKATFKAGFHFMIVAQKKLVLDYSIGKSAEKKVQEKQSSPSDGGKASALTTTQASSSPSKSGQGQSSKAKYKKAIGPLTIRNIGCKYADDTLSILMDATFAFGPVTLDLFGFSLGLHFKGGLKKPSGGIEGFFTNVDVRVSISGLGVEFNKPPLTISGAFLHEKQGNAEYYAGGLTVGFSPWLFKAAGMYGTIELARDQKLKCFFMYVTVRGPIFTFEFAEVSGLTGGFGYNIDLTLPTIDQVMQFPLLSPEPEGKSTRDTIRDLLPKGEARAPFFNPLDGARWLAAGLTVTAFQMLEITALVVVQWSPHVQLAILGLAVCDVPSPKSPVKFAHVELGILATVDLQGGVFKVEAQLSPNSYILHPSCHLTGGFALYYWFKSEQSAVEGDWVCSVGGYHSAFLVPKHYPRPERLAISWSIDDNLSISGQAYFAITPKVCMGGIHIRAALSLGPLRAWFEAYADFLINFAPFNFQAVAHVSVGIAYSMNVWFVTVNISAEIGATLTLAGPPFRGNVHVDFWVFGFDIAFGDHSAPEEKALDIQKFWDLVMQAKRPQKDGQPKLPHLFTCQQGLLTDGKQETKPSDPWLVRGGTFEFAVSAYFAIENLFVNDVPVTKPDRLDDIYARPMKTGSRVNSRVDVYITRSDDSTAKGWTISPTVKSVPQGIWGPYDGDKDPSRRDNNINDLLKPDGGTSRLMMGLKLEAPQPRTSKDTMPQFVVEQAMEAEVQYEEGKEPTFERLPKDSRAWIPMPELDDADCEAGEPTQWEAVRAAWEKDEADLVDSVDLCEELFGWTDSLVAIKPRRLIKNISKLYLKAPLLGLPSFEFA